MKNLREFFGSLLLLMVCFVASGVELGFAQCSSGSRFGESIFAVADSSERCEQKALVKLLTSRDMIFSSSYTLSSGAAERRDDLSSGPSRELQNEFRFLSRRYNSRVRAWEFQFRSSQMPNQLFTVQLLSPLQFQYQIVGLSHDSYQYSCTLRTQGCHGFVGQRPGGTTYGRWGSFGSQVVRIFNGAGDQLIRFSNGEEGLGEDYLNPECPLSWSWACD